MSKHFCCCIPVRFGVFVFSLFHFLAEGVCAAIVWFWLHLALKGEVVDGNDWSQINNAGKISLGVIAGVFSLLALIAFGGWIGSIARSRALVKIYSTTTWITVIVTAAASGYMLYLVYSGKNFFKGCEVNGQQCEFHFKWWQKFIYTVSTVVALLINCYIASVIGKYVDQLDSENHTWSREYQPAKVAGASTYEPTYYPQQAQEVNQGLLNPAAGPYPYTDHAHRFGSNA
ncbi:hypothetical protein PsYK624_086140 [Phanerochaete sordida]|uniref:Uncharacterized protein n=1 Tax=Phanerochaete sordida TaxID=48140 RepID=A0A9P3GET7_9APHY|nr:hypothetical protein PsYK624_086140 [Phanerochaete sordida]